MVKIPPIKSQGIKTKLVPWIGSIVPRGFSGRWIEPFMGTGVVGFNVAPDGALMCDANPHVVDFYQSINAGDITPERVRAHLEREGSILLDKGARHYYAIRERFNDKHAPLDFLFLNRAGFNGMIRFNRSGSFNIPFCKKPQRFSKAYITKIVNQVSHLHRLFARQKFVFRCQSFEDTILSAEKEDIIYCDPPYINRHVDYYNGWDGCDEKRLFKMLSDGKGDFILSTWHHNKYRKNEYMDSLWNKHVVFCRDHFYHVGARKQNRNSMVEALVTNMRTPRLEPAEDVARTASLPTLTAFLPHP